MKKRPAAVLVTAMLLPIPSSCALEIVLDYSHDTATDNFFDTHPVAKASLERARSDIQAAITTILSGIGGDSVSGKNGGTTATFNFSHTYVNPSTGAPQSIPDSTVADDVVTIFVGMRELGGSVLGQGGPGGTGVSISGSGFPSEWPGAMDAANVAGTDQRLRAGGPIMNTISSTVQLGGTDGTLAVDCGPSISNLWFDIDTNNDSNPDPDITLEAAWHFDWNTPVASGKADFYSVALHEMLHSLGAGTSRSWTDNVSGNDWLGAEVIAAHGTGSGLIVGGSHVAPVSSPRLSDGLFQEVVMSPALELGTRKTLTALDLAFLRDINWQTIPEPTSAALSLAAAGLLGRRRRS